jgi:FkbM family methyltransferase
MFKNWKLYNDQSNDFFYKSFDDNKELTTFWGHDFIYKEIYNFEDSKTGCIYEMWDCTLKSGDIVVDLGANAGFFSVKASQVASEVIAIDGSPEAYSCLVENTKDIDNIKTLNALIMSDNSDYNGLWSKKGNPLRMDLDKVMELFQIDKIDFLKCDIEGGEYDLFESLSLETLSKIDRIAVETHDNKRNENFMLPGKIRHSFYWEFMGSEQVMYYFVTPKEKVNYSQNNEQEIIEQYFEKYDSSELCFLDIGANDGVSFSNTYNLSLKGWSGICLEPSINAFNKMKINYKDNEKMILCNYGISNVTDKLKFYESGNWIDAEAPTSILSTLSSEERNRFEGMNWTETICDFYTFKDFLEKENLNNYTFDFINIDCEGYDFIVLKQIDLNKFNVKLICIEFIDEKTELEIKSYMTNMNFKLLQKTNDNLIFCKN